MDNVALSAKRQGVPAYLAWGKKLLLCLDFLFLALIAWLFGRWTGGAWLASPALWLTLTGGTIFLIREKYAYRLFWLCALCMVGGAVSIFLPLWSVILAQVLLGAALLLLAYLGVRYALGRYYVDIDLMVQP